MYNASNNSKQDKQISSWLLICCVFVVLIVAVGGATRLTDSGLSIVDWHPIHGIIPPIGEEQWLEEFSNYQKSPEYLKVNYDMQLDEFKYIFYWEYIHRILGRMIGLIFFVPFLYFLTKKYFSKTQSLKFLFIFSLGGLQGFIGWWMVKSGLVDSPDVSHFRLATHLSLALIIEVLLFWQFLNFYITQEKATTNSNLHKNKNLSKIKRLSLALILVIFTQIIFGAFLAGLDGGLIYNSWPLMGEVLIPPHTYYLRGLDTLHDIAFVQFIHRWLPVVILIIAYKMHKSLKNLLFYTNSEHAVDFTTVKTKEDIPSSFVNIYRLVKACNMMKYVLLLQIILGIATLVLQVPLILALCHQLMAVILLLNAVFVNYITKRQLYSKY